MSCFVGVAQAARRAMKQGAWLRALLVTLRLKDAALLRQVILGTPPQDVSPPRLLLLNQNWGAHLACVLCLAMGTLSVSMAATAIPVRSCHGPRTSGFDCLVADRGLNGTAGLWTGRDDRWICADIRTGGCPGSSCRVHDRLPSPGVPVELGPLNLPQAWHNSPGVRSAPLNKQEFPTPTLFVFAIFTLAFGSD